MPNHEMLQIVSSVHGSRDNPQQSVTIRDWTNCTIHALNESMHLSDYMAKNGLKDTDVAEAIHVHRITVNRYRRRTKMPHWKAVEAIRKFTNGRVTPNDWLPKLERVA